VAEQLNKSVILSQEKQSVAGLFEKLQLFTFENMD
jgi:hypothetical protein